MATQAQIAAVQQLYIGYLGRAADKAGLDFWTNAVSTGVSTLASVATGFTLSTEYKAAFGGLTNDALVEKVYTSVLGRASDTAGKAFWVDALAKGTVTSDKLVATFIGALSAPDQTIINNKTFVAQTYTDTVGASYNTTAGTSVIAGVNGTTASVNTALANITNGTLTGLTPGVSLINSIATANAAVEAFGKAAALTNPTFDGIADSDATPNSPLNAKDGVVTQVEAGDALATATAARFNATTLSTKSTADLTADANTAATNAAAAKAAVGLLTGGSAAASTYDNALAALKVQIGTAASASAATTAAEAATAAAAASVKSVLDANGLLTGAAAVNAVTYATLSAKFAGNATAITTVDQLVSALKTPGVDTATIAAHTALVTELAKVTTYGPLLTTSTDKEVAITKASTDLGNASDALHLIDNTLTAGVNEGDAYASAAGTQSSSAALLTKAQTADLAVAAAKAVVDQYTTLNNDVIKAQTALNTFQAANTDKVAFANLSGAVTSQATVKSDVFYFGTKVAVDTTPDISLGGTTNFGAGDSIVLGSGYTFNSGALSTGSNSVLEVFLVKGTTGTQVVIESAAYGNASTVVGADGNVTASPNATVINLVGVTADHLSVANGVVSYV